MERAPTHSNGQSLPSTRICPESGLISPIARRSNTDLPDAETPVRRIISLTERKADVFQHQVTIETEKDIAKLIAGCLPFESGFMAV